MVIVMGTSSQLCCYCNEITERTSDGDRLACSMCGRPYLVAPDQPMPYACPADPTPHAEEDVPRPETGPVAPSDARGEPRYDFLP
jgi:hypothetical protein